MTKSKWAATRSQRKALENAPINGSDELISWEEAEWTREALGMSKTDFAQMLGVNLSVIYLGQNYPDHFLKPQEALLLRLGVNQRQSRPIVK